MTDPDDDITRGISLLLSLRLSEADWQFCIIMSYMLLPASYVLLPSMQSDELDCQKKLRTEIIQLEETLAQVRKEYEMSRIELEQALAANEQTGPINR